MIKTTSIIFRMQLFFFIIFFCTQSAHANKSLEFTLHKLESGIPGPTVLVVGGIQGDEPGGFHAASLLVTNYKITRGSIWVVPNLNFESIVQRSRGVNGDMNRKFATVRINDPDYPSVQRIKDLIVNSKVDMIFNLHDGSGFYRTQHIDNQHNPERWGQSLIIDQETVASERFSHIGELTRSASEHINQRLLKPEHQYAVKNTHTRSGNTEMEKTLTYFAINNGKSAVGIETSKSLPTHERAYYHLLAIETLLSSLGVEVQCDFELRPAYVKNAINNNLQIALYQSKVRLDITHARSRINYVPMQKNIALEFIASNPLLAITNMNGSYNVNYGNRRITKLHPQYIEYDSSLEAITISANGQQNRVPLGNTLVVDNNFTISPVEGYRFNVIGWTRKGVHSEAGYPIVMDNIAKQFSVDRNGRIFRVEVYKGSKFSGMVLVKFDPAKPDSNVSAQINNTKDKTGS